MLMGFGPFRFTIPNFSVEELTRRTSGRVAQADVIGAAPITHLLGPGVEELSLSSVFHPRHMNKGGPALLAALHALAEQQTPQMFVSITGFVFGRWVLTEVSGAHSVFTYGGRAETIKADISLQKFNGGSAAGRFGVF